MLFRFDIGRLVGLGVRSQRDAVRLREGGHLGDVAVEHLEVEHQRRRVERPPRALLAHQVTVLPDRWFRSRPAKEKKRLLLRLWLTVPQGRPVGAAIHQRAAVYAKVHEHLQAQKALA